MVEIITVILFVAFSYLEALLQFAKYSSYHTNAFNGGVYANAISIVSRIFFSAGAILLAYMIERNGSSSIVISYVCLSALIGSALVTFAIRNKIIRSKEFNVFKLSYLVTVLFGNAFEKNSAVLGEEKKLIIMAPLAFFNVGAFFIIYVASSIYYENRMVIASVSPLVSMLGTLLMVLYLDPKIANCLSLGVFKADVALKLMIYFRLISYVIGISSMCLFIGCYKF
jgi:hypothetical protein